MKLSKKSIIFIAILWIQVFFLSSCGESVIYDLAERSAVSQEERNSIVEAGDPSVDKEFAEDKSDEATDESSAKDSQDTVESKNGDATAGAGENANTEETASKTASSSQIYVHVCGAVNAPGLYGLPQGSRAAAAIDAAGGYTEDASQESQNLARLLTDGEQLRVPTREEANAGQTYATATSGAQSGTVSGSQTGTSSATGSDASSVNSESVVNINLADRQTLMTLSGIGEAKADAIIQYRSDAGGFQSIEELTNVSGIGDATFQKLKDKITVS